MGPSPLNVQLGRRGFLAATIAGGFALAGCSSRPPAPPAAPSGGLSAAIAAAEAARPHTGRAVTAALTPQAATVDLGGPT
ncbi:hypothetical protein INN88_14860, partial [Staphylococcus aureus]|nr:hypothetical protein [Staphylococcus aureus]